MDLIGELNSSGKSSTELFAQGERTKILHWEKGSKKKRKEETNTKKQKQLYVPCRKCGIAQITASNTQPKHVPSMETTPLRAGLRRLIIYIPINTSRDKIPTFE